MQQMRPPSISHYEIGSRCYLPNFQTCHHRRLLAGGSSWTAAVWISSKTCQQESGEEKKFSASQNTQFKFNSENNYLELLVLPVMRSELSQIHVEIYGFTYILFFSCPQKGRVVMQSSKKKLKFSKKNYRKLKKPQIANFELQLF